MFRKPRPKTRRSNTRPKRKSAVRSPIGRDFKRVRAPHRLGNFVPAALAVLLAAFALTSLRTEVLKLKYELTHLLEREQELRASQGELTVQMRTLVEPRQLAQRAAELGFERPQRVIDLPVSAASVANEAVATHLDAPADATIPSQLNTAVDERLAAVPGSFRP